jgi:hypothetical protein
MEMGGQKNIALHPVAVQEILIYAADLQNHLIHLRGQALP